MSRASKGTAARKRVLTIGETELRPAAEALLAQMAERGFKPDAVIGVEAGGGHVLRSVAPSLAIPAYYCTLRRPTTETKERLGMRSGILRRLPYKVTDWLRVIEDRRGERRAQATSAVVAEPTPTLNSDLDRISSELARRCTGAAPRVAVVDDAADSGQTIAVILRGLRTRLPDADVRSAVITRTRSPELMAAVPDYSLYEYVLCRFPWSFDFHGGSSYG